MCKHHEYFKKMEIAFEEAASIHSNLLRSSYYNFCGHYAKASCVGCDLARSYERILSHLQTVENKNIQPELNIKLWDQSKSDINYPVAILDENSYQFRTVTASPDSRFVFDQDPETTLAFDRKTQNIVISVASAERLNHFDRAKPFNRLLSLWLRDRGIQTIHAAMTAKGRKGILFTGKGGSGKSSSILASVLAGFDFLGDDYIGLQETTTGSFVGHSLYNSILLEAEHLQSFGLIGTDTYNGNPARGEKVIIYTNETFTDQLVRSAPISALVLPKIVNSAHSQVFLATKVEALLSLAPSSLKLQISPKVWELDQQAELVERVPCFWLELGHNMDEIPKCIDNMLEKLEIS
jgi:hypothetical protein